MASPLDVLLAVPPATIAYWAALLALAAALLVLLLGVLAIAREMIRPAPTGGTPVTLPNGMQIQQWQQIETDFLFKEIFGDHSVYTRGGLQFAPGQTIVDAGANIGMFTLAAAWRTRGQARILAFEPIPSTFAVLDANVKRLTSGSLDAQLNIDKDRFRALHVEAFNVGLSDAPAKVEFAHHPRVSIWSTSDESFAADRRHRFACDVAISLKTSPDSVVARAMPSWLAYWLTRLLLSALAATVRVPVTLVTLSSILDAAKVTTIDVLKIDVEGAELSVLRGIAPRHWKLVQQVVLEVETFAAVAAVSDILRANGFDVSSFASEREGKPDITSEVSMVYGIRPGYTPPGVAAPAVLAGATSEPSPSRRRSPSATSARKRRA